jgi:hypothetical protein
MAHDLPVAVLPGNLREPPQDDKFVDVDRRITTNWYRWTVFVDVSLRRMIKLFTFLSLTDTPDSYAGQTHKVVRVNAGETALEFAAIAGLPAGGATGQVLTKINSTDFNADWETPAPGYTDEQAQDAVGGMVDGTLVYVDATPLLTRAGLTGDVTAAQGSNLLTIGAGKVTEAMQLLANNTTNNVSTSKHGYAPVLPNDATKYMDGTGVYSTPAGGGFGIVTGSGAPSASQSAGTVYSRSDQAGVYVDTSEKILKKVQSQSASGTGVPASLTLGGAPTPGNWLIAFLGSSNDMHALLDLTKWTPITSGGTGATGSQILAAYRLVQVGDTTSVPALSASNASSHAQIVIEISGGSGIWSHDFEQTDAKYGQVTGTLATNSVNTLYNNDLILTGIFNYDGASNISGGSGFAFDVQGNNNSNFGAWALAQASFATSGTAVSTSYTIPDATHPGGYLSIFLTGGGEWTKIEPLPVIDKSRLLYNNASLRALPIQTTLSDAIDDAIGSTRGSVLLRGASGWALLPPGLATYVLTSNGSGADPSYQVAPGGGGAGTPPTIVQNAISVAASGSITLGAGPTNGNLLVAITGNPSTGSAGTGWTIQSQNTSGTDFFQILTKVAGAGESATQTPTPGAVSASIIGMWEIHGAAATPIIFVSAGAPVTNAANSSASIPGIPNVLNLALIDIMGGSGAVTNFLNMTQDQIASSGTRRGAMGHSDGSKAIAQLVALLSASVGTKAGIISLTA